jgi:Transposase
MTSMATKAVFVTGGVDTHGHTHHAAVLDYMGRQLADREFPTSAAAYRALLQWMGGHGVLDRVGVEGTGTYGSASHGIPGSLVYTPSATAPTSSPSFGLAPRHPEITGNTVGVLDPRTAAQKVRP